MVTLWLMRAWQSANRQWMLQLPSRCMKLTRMLISLTLPWGLLQLQTPVSNSASVMRNTRASIPNVPRHGSTMPDSTLRIAARPMALSNGNLPPTLRRCEMRQKLFVLLVMCVVGSTCLCPRASAQYAFSMLADTLADSCRASARVDDGGATAPVKDIIVAQRCVGYLMGVLDGFEMVRASKEMDPAHTICMPEGVRDQQVVRIFMKYVNDHPDVLNKSAPAVVWLAMHQAYPCP